MASDWLFNDSTTVADPGTGQLSFNNADPTLATLMLISNTSQLGDASAFLDALLTQDARLVQTSNQAWKIYRLGAQVNHGAFRGVNLTFVDQSSVLQFPDGENIRVEVTGAVGATGPTGPTGPAGTPNVGTQGQVPFVNAAGSDLAYDSRIFWDSSTGRLGLGTAAPSYRLDMQGGRARFRGDNSLEPAIIITSPDGGSQGSIRVSDGGNLLLANDTPGNVYLRPNGQGSATGEFYITPDGRMRANYNGSAATPAYGWTGDNDTGIYRPGDNTLALTAGGSPILAARATEVANLRPVEFAGTRGEPVTGHSNPWIYRTTDDGSAGYPFNQFGNLVIQARSNSNNHIVFVTGITPVPVLSVTVDGRIRAHTAGSAAFPIFSWFDDTDTGVYRPAPDSVGISAGGVTRMSVSANYITANRPIVLAEDVGAIYSASNNQMNLFSGGSTSSAGANVVVHGSSHASQASVGQLRAGSTVMANWSPTAFTVPTTLVIPVK